MDATVMEQNVRKPKKTFFSKPLFVQSLKANWVFWLIMTIGCAAIFVIINLVINTKGLFTKLDMQAVSAYVEAEGMSWLQILGLLEKMGFSLSRIQVMSQIDINSIMNDLIYKIAGVMLPMIYVMIVSNKLIAAQVNDGSMAYVLSTPTNRKAVVRTQFIFLLTSLFAMYVLITSFAMASEAIANQIKLANEPNATVTSPLRSLIYCFASFASIFALGGICFGASCYFNKSSRSVALGGGVCVVSFLASILGLFGNKVFVAVGIGVSSMNVFNYISIFTLIDNDSISNFIKALNNGGAFSNYDDCFSWIWKIAIMFAIGAIVAYLCAKKFNRKDLPL